MPGSGLHSAFAAPADQSASASAPGGLLGVFRRITSSGRYVPEVDGLRFVAITSVFIYHLAGDALRRAPAGTAESYAGGWLFELTQRLNFGVPLFFVLSGFILGVPFASAHLRGGPAVPLAKYFVRRVTRLEPPYLICLVVLFLAKIAAGRGTADSLWPHLLASSLYVHNSWFNSSSPINVVAWSLEIEVQFYLLAPFLAQVFAVRPTALRRTVIVGAIAAVILVQSAWLGTRAFGNILGHAQYFFTGFLLADLHVSDDGRWQPNARWDFVALLGWPLLGALLTFAPEVLQWASPLLILPLYVAAFRGRATSRVFRTPWLCVIGGMCYSIYLFHNNAIALVGSSVFRLQPDGPFGLRLLVHFALVTPVVLVACAAFYLLVERPCMRPDWPSRLLRTLRREAPLPVSPRSE
jgi:peptidoglycan/LPS O-acetylase OafA/YrhL